MSVVDHDCDDDDDDDDECVTVVSDISPDVAVTNVKSATLAFLAVVSVIVTAMASPATFVISRLLSVSARCSSFHLRLSVCLAVYI